MQQAFTISWHVDGARDACLPAPCWALEGTQHPRICVKSGQALKDSAPSSLANPCIPRS